MITDSNLTKYLADLADQVNQAGAEGIWLIRGAKNARLLYEPAFQAEPPDLPGVAAGLSLVPGIQVTTNLTFSLAVADSGVLVVIRFPASDGGEPGIESK